MSRPRLSLNPYLVLAGGLLLTALATLAVQRAVSQRDALRFDNAVSGTQDRIANRLHAYEAVLRSTAALFSVEGDAVTRDEFRRFVAAIDVQTVYPGIQGIGYHHSFPASELSSIEERMRREGVADFRVWPEGPREQYFAILFIEPEDRRNRAALGYDMSTDAVRRDAIERARDTGAPAMSATVTLVQEIDPEKQPGFLVFVPVYRNGALPVDPVARRAAFQGLVYAPFRGRDLFDRIFETERQRVAFTVHDGATSGAVLYASPRDPSHKVLFETTRTLDFGGHRWAIAYETTPVFTEGSSRDIVPYALGVGVAVSMLLFLIARAQWRSAEAARAAEARAQSERKNLHALFMQAPAAIAILRGEDFRYELSNPLNQRLAGGLELVGKSITEAMPEVAAQGLLVLLEQVYATGQPFVGKEVPIELKAADGTTTKLYLNGIYEALRAADGTIEGVMAFAYDVTDEVIARQKVEALAEDLKAAVRTRDDFLSIAGHELKTPLTALSLQLQVMLRAAEQHGGAQQLQPEVRRRIERALNHLRRLQALVQELLDVSRITSGRLQLHLEQVDFVEVIREAADRFADEATREKAQLVVSAPAALHGQWDRIRLEQVVSNLVANALKYGAGKPVELKLEQNKGHAVLSITDHGIGIAQEDQERIFGRFERAVSERNYGGLGLGLWITRQIVDAFGGSISCVSVHGQGSTFTVELPLSRPQ